MSTCDSTERNLDHIFFALSDSRRRRVLDKLRGGPMIVKQLGEEFHLSKPAVGKHIKILEDSGLIRRVAKGRVHECSLDPAVLETVSAWLNTYRRYWEESLQSLADYSKSVNREKS